MLFNVQCAPASSGPSVAPCTDVGTTAYVPVMIEATIAEYDYANSAQLHGWAISAVLMFYLAGVVVGSIMRVIRSV